MSEAKKRRVLQKFKAEYADRYPNIIVKSNIDEYHARCNICKADIGIGHGGLHDLERHVSSEKHKSIPTSYRYLQHCLDEPIRF